MKSALKNQTTMNKEYIEQLAGRFLADLGYTAFSLNKKNAVQVLLKFTEHLIEKGEVRHKDETFECALCEREKSIFNRTEGRPNVCSKCSVETATPAKVISDEEIEKAAQINSYGQEVVGFFKGAKWMREQLSGRL